MLIATKISLPFLVYHSLLAHGTELLLLWVVLDNSGQLLFLCMVISYLSIELHAPSDYAPDGTIRGEFAEARLLVCSHQPFVHSTWQVASAELWADMSFQGSPVDPSRVDNSQSHLIFQHSFFSRWLCKSFFTLINPKSNISTTKL